jgi:hypothetical protein
MQNLSILAGSRFLAVALLAAVLISQVNCGSTSSGGSGNGGGGGGGGATVSISISPAATTVPTEGSQVFAATVTVTGGGPAVTLAWSVNGIPGGNATVGMIVTSSATKAIYTAPVAPPTPATVTITAASTTDASQFGTATATITCAAGNSVSPPSVSVSLTQMQSFTASFCTVPGTAITWDVDGVAGGNATLGTIVSSTAISALYTAPANLPAANPVTIHATAPSPNGGPSISASATVTLISGVVVSVAPSVVALAVSQRTSLTASVTGSSDTSVTWSVNSVPNGNTSLGQICVSGTNPCVAPGGPAPGTVDFLAPASLPATNPVSVTATSAADPSRSGSASITITGTKGAVALTVSPTYVFLPPSTGTPSTQQFEANVTGTGNTAVMWRVTSGVADQGCAGTACGSVNTSGLFTAPMVASSPNAIAVVATSVADSTKSASATVAIISAPTIESLSPSSTMAGAVEGFALSVQGVNFVAGAGSSASAILINGSARSTTCTTVTDCTTALAPTDVQNPGTLTIQIQNPGNPVALSNPVPFVILPFNVMPGTTPLTGLQPLQAGENIFVADPTTAAASSPINVAAAGPFSSGNCTIDGSPITVTRPVSGTLVASICVYGNDLDPAFTYTFTSANGAPNDISVSASAIPGLLPGLIELDLQLSSTTVAGLRTLFITTVNNDRAVATGILEVK